MSRVNAVPAAARASHSPAALSILVLASDPFPPRRVDVSVLFGEELAGRGHRIDYLLQSEAPCSLAYVTNWGGGRAWVGPTDLGTSLLSRIHKHVLGIVHDLAVFRRLRTGRYDILEVKDKFISAVFALLAARLYHTRFVFWLSYPFAEEYSLKAKDGTARYRLLYAVRGAAFAVLLYRILLPAAQHIFVQSERMRQDLAGKGIPLDKMTAVPMGIQPERFMSPALDRVRYVLPPDQPCILYLGTLNKVRRLDFLVRVLERVRRQLPRARLYVVGSGDHPSDEQVLIQESQRLGLSDAVVMVGQLAHGEALRYVQAADVCVSPFFPTPVLISTSPTKLVEYLAMGKPVVANDHPEQRLVLEQSGGGYCVPWDEEAFAAAIVSLLNNPTVAAEMGERGRQYVLQHRSYGKIADLVETTFRQIVHAS